MSQKPKLWIYIDSQSIKRFFSSSFAFPAIRDWISFYEKEYPLVGVVADLYYDSDGQPTAELTDVLARIEKANEYRKAQAVEIEVFPPCNSEYNQNGGRVWCSTKSGGVERQWAGVPR